MVAIGKALVHAIAVGLVGHDEDAAFGRGKPWRLKGLPSGMHKPIAPEGIA